MLLFVNPYFQCNCEFSSLKKKKNVCRQVKVMKVVFKKFY